MAYPYKRIDIGYRGRAKYSEGTDGNSVVRSIKNFFGGGGGSTDTRGGDSGENRGTNGTSFFAYLDKGSGSYSDIDLAGTGVTETIHLYGFKNMDRAQTLVGDVSEPSACTQYDALTCTNPYSIIGFPSSGMQIEVIGNGTTGTTIKLYITSSIADEGELRIPVSVNVNDNPLDPYHEVWNKFQNWTQNTTLAFTWKKAGVGSSSYIMDLSNDRAGVNVSATTAQGDILYPASIASITCSAFTWFGTDLVTGATYRKEINPSYQARGVDITQNGVMVFDSTFNFNGSTLPIDIFATVDGVDVGVKTFTVEKNYPSDGQAAVTRWIVADHDVVRYNPNTSAITPSVLKAWVMKQVGGDEPFKDTATTVYYGYDTTTPTQTLNFDSDYVVSAKTYYNVSSTTFALKNSNNIFYEIEEIPTLWDGLNGATGAQGASGRNGTDGVDGQSAWYLTLDNDNASVNANASGVIYTQAIKPVCHAKLFYGSQQLREDASFRVDWGNATGISSSVTNGILTIDANHSNLAFPDDVLSIAVSGYSGSTSTEVKDVKYFNITKSKAGADGADGQKGADAVSYWLSLDYTSVIFNKNTSAFTPSAITAVGYRQVGEEAFTPSPDTYIVIKYKKRSTGTWTGTTSANSATVTAKKCVDNDTIRFTLYKGQIQLDQEDVDIICDGMDGKDGAQGRQGAAIRGPYDYYAVSASQQCWCAGESSSTCSDCDKWIDVVLKDGTFYVCKKTYTGSCATTAQKGIANTTYWTEGENFDFVATRVLLASAASINFLTNNWLYLKDENGDIVGGARGTSVDSGITFWSGSEDPEDASFRVDYQGNLYANKGTFAGYIQFPFTNLNRLNSATTTIDGVQYEVYSADTRAYIIAYPLIDDTNRALRLPVPSSGLNGFTYDLIIHPALSRSERSVDLNVFVSGGTDIISYAFSTIKQGDHIILTSGRFQITCIPNYQGGYRWALISASGNLIFRNSGYDDEYVSTLLATSYDTQGMINNVHTYTGNKPSSWNDSTTMYVKK